MRFTRGPWGEWENSMGKRVPHVNEAGAALQTDTAAKAEAGQSMEKGLRSKSAKRASSSGDLVPPVSAQQAEDDAVKAKQGGSLFERIRSRIKGNVVTSREKSPDEAAAAEFMKRGEEPTPLDRQIQETPRKGELANAIRLEVGQDKLLVNQRKITDRVRKILLAIEAQDTYLRSIALKVVSRKHQGVVIDLPKRGNGESDDSLGSGHEGPVAKLLGRKPNKD